MSDKIYNIGCYLIDRLMETGCNHFFGVPGDYNLRFLDDVLAKEGLSWIGCTNELNAAYATDGYARCRRFGVLVTTYGVGELSAVNGVAGSTAESVPVIHLVFGPSLKSEADHALVHHSLGDGWLQHFSRMSEEISCSIARLRPENAQLEIDRVITDILYFKKPGYILIPCDVAGMSSNPPHSPLQLRVHELSDPSLLQFRKAIEKMFENAKSPAALIGHLCDRYSCNDICEEMVDDAHLPFAHMYFGKGTVNEQSPNYVGCYYGSSTLETTRKIIEDADVCVVVGAKFLNFDKDFINNQQNLLRTVRTNPFCSYVGHEQFGQIPMHAALQTVRDVAVKYCDNWPKVHPSPVRFSKPNDEKFFGHHFWYELQQNLKPNDLLVSDVGTSSGGVAGLVLPKGSKFCQESLWGSIGYSIPAAFGAQIAEPNRRVILIVGDGAAQMTCQELGSFSRFGLTPIIFLMNNEGYAIERLTHGENEVYNDISSWDWCALMKALSPRRKVTTSILNEVGKCHDVLSSFTDKPKELTFCEVILGKCEKPVVQLDYKDKFFMKYINSWKC